MTTTTEIKLQSKIVDIKKQIKDKQAFLVKLEKELQEFLDSNKGLYTPVNQSIDDKNLNPVELLKQVQLLKQKEEKRLSDLQDFERAKSLFQEKIKDEIQALKKLELDLTELESELDWQIKYLPHAERLGSKFIDDYEKDTRTLIKFKNHRILEIKGELEKINTFLADDDAVSKKLELKVNRFINYESAVNLLETLPKEIDRLRAEIQKLENSQDFDFNNYPEFRNHIKGKLNIESELNHLIEVQSSYVEAVNALKAKVGESEINRKAINFDLLDWQFKILQVVINEDEVTINSQFV